MKIISWNVNGLRAVHKKGLFLPFLKEHNPDILCLQEIKSKKDQNEIDLPEYTEFWNPATRAGYSGTAIFTKQKPVSVSHNLPEVICVKYGLDKDQFGDPNTEGRVLTLEYETFFLVTVYTPNSKRELTRLTLRHKQWDPAFLAYVDELQRQKPVIFCGDLNVAHTADDLANPKQNEGEHGYTKEEREGVDNIIKKGFVDTFRHFISGNGHYTWWTHWQNARERNVGWRIDYFFISNTLLTHLKSAHILANVMGSDHCPVEIEIEK